MFPSTNSDGNSFWPGLSPMIYRSVLPRLGLADSQVIATTIINNNNDNNNIFKKASRMCTASLCKLIS